MRFKGRFVKDLEVVNVPKEPVVEINHGNGVKELRPGIDVLSVFPVERKKVNKNKDIMIIASALLSAFLAGASFIGMFFISTVVCGAIFIGSLAWLAFVLWANKYD